MPTADPEHRAPAGYLLRTLAVAALVFAAVAPTLSWLEFSSGSENLVVETVLEMRRGGPWVVPTLELQPRTQKPPLTAWLTAAAVRPEAVAALWDRDAARRNAAYDRLAWQVRWPALASSCLMLLAVYGLGRIVAGARVGILAAAVCGTTVLFLRYGRYATTDVQLALWVAVANVGLAWAVLERRWGAGCIVGGVALGLALISKGPVCLVQTVLPVAAFAGWRAWCRRAGEGDASAETAVPSSRTPRPLLAIAAGLLLMAAVGLPWYAYMLRQNPAVSGLWVKEVTRVGATEDPPDRVFTYLILIPLLLPWSAFFVAGVIGATTEAFRRRGNPIVLALFLVAVPVAVMTLSPDRKDRYLQPMVVPAAVLAAWAVREIARPWPRAEGGGRVVLWAHWLLLAAAAVGLPIIGALPQGPLQSQGGGPWFTWSLAGPAAAGLGGIVLAGIVLHRRWRGALVTATVATMLGLQAVAVHGYGRSPDGRSDLKPLADAVWAAYPDAETHFRHNRRSPNDLSIYLDRPTPHANDLATIRPGPRPQVAFLVGRAGKPPPDVPAGWQLLTTLDRGGSRVYAYVLPAAASPVP